MLKDIFDIAYQKVSKKIIEVDNNTNNINITNYIGRVKKANGTVIIASIPKVKVGDLCIVEDESIKLKMFAEVIAINLDDVTLLPFGTINSISNNALVYKHSENFLINVGDFLLGKVVDGMGNILSDMLSKDVEESNSKVIYRYPIIKLAPDPLKRKLIVDKLITGVKSIDMFITCAKGQRLAIFAGPGMGKTTLMSMIIKNAHADVIVVALIGERGREVREFIELDLTSDMKKKTIVVSVTSDRPPVEQLKSAYVAQTIAEYFRDQGKNVILFVDSITRFARAGREVGLSAGEPITRGGYPPSVFLSFPRLMERAGNSDIGSITAFYTVLMEGEVTNQDPIADEVRSIVDGHILLSKKLVEQGHFPAINVLTSLSRIADRVISKEQLEGARKLRLLLSKYDELEFLIRVGEYKSGKDALADEAIEKHEKIMNFLKQSVHNNIEYDDTLNQLLKIVNSR